ncbi:MAG: 2'-5' RNA ligase family protein [Acidobacteriota bacterium]
MKVAVVAYPRLAAADRERIESFRQRHDPQASRLGVHFTLVFPCEMQPDHVSQEIASVAQETSPITFVVRRAELVRDVFGSGSHVFLTPGDGSSQLTELHDRLYAGVFREHLRADIPFTPHMTVAAAEDVESGERLVIELDIGSRLIAGVVDCIELVDVGTPRVETIAAYPLGLRV